MEQKAPHVWKSVRTGDGLMSSLVQVQCLCSSSRGLILFIPLSHRFLFQVLEVASKIVSVIFERCKGQTGHTWSYIFCNVFNMQV